MKLSRNFTRTTKDIPSDEVSKNAQLLIKAGFIHKTMAGVYSYLPLGLRVINKIENALRLQLDNIGGQEILMSSLSPKENWIKTNRWKEIPEYFCLQSQSGAEYRLNPTHEELVTPIAANYVKTYKDLPDFDETNNIYPLSIYQIQNKFRDEVRAKAGMLRGREFHMKDMYDFHKTKESQEAFFEKITQTYFKFYNFIGLEAYKVNASGGVFSEKFSREFQTVCVAGEDWLYIDKSIEEVYNQEVAPCVAPIFDYTKEPEKIKEDLYLESIIGTTALIKLLNIDITRSTKTLFYIDSDKKFVVAVVRSDRSISNEKLQKIHGKSLTLATNEVVIEKTGAEIGYAGIINLPEDLIVYYDDSLKYMKNFETGTNKTHYHSINICFGRDLKYPDKFYDIKEAIENDVNPNTGSVYVVKRGSEVGNIFDLGQKWVKAFGVKYLDKDNVLQYPYMGCHGIGTSRCMGVIAELHSDEKGLKWPLNVAPYQVHLITHLGKDEEINRKILAEAEAIYSGIGKQVGDVKIYSGEVLWDDRNSVSLGVKFKDADLIGCPVQIVITERTIARGEPEVRVR